MNTEMNITVEIPVRADGMSPKETEEFKQYLQQSVESEIKRRFGPGARMFDTVCRFMFLEAKVVV